MTSTAAVAGARARGGLALSLVLSGLCAACTGSVATSPSLVDARTSLLKQAPATWAASPGPAATIAATGAAAGHWWTDFGDSTLDALVLEALANNHDLQAAAARVAIAEAEARISGADLLPSLRLGGDVGRSRQVFVGLPIPQAEGAPGVLASTATQYGVSLDLSWEIDLWGRLRSADAAAGAQAEAVRITYEGARLSLAGQTAKAWFALVEAGEQVALAEETLATYRSAADQVRARYERGTRSPLDLRLALTQLAGAEARLADRRSLLERTARQLELLLARYPAAELAAALTSRSSILVAGDGPAAIPAGVPAGLLSRRPDLAAAAQVVYAADQNQKAAKAALLPRIALTGRAGTVSDDVADLLDGDFGVWTIASNLVQPIFEGGRLRAGVDRAKAESGQAMAEYAAIALQAFFEVENALADEGHVAAVVAALVSAAGQSEAAERLAGERYRSGLETYVTVLAAQRSALDAKSSLLSARRSRLDNRVDLHLALGGGFIDPAAATPVHQPGVLDPAAAAPVHQPGFRVGVSAPAATRPASPESAT